MFKALRALALLAPVAFLLGQTSAPDGPFLEKPYLQLGNSPRLSSPESLMLLWHTSAEAGNWGVEIKTSKDASWRAMDKPATTSVDRARNSRASGLPLAAQGPGSRRRLPISGIEIGRRRFCRFRTRAEIGRPANSAVVFGDCAQGTPASRAIAYQASLAKPDFVLIPGDIVYSSGRISEYREKFFPVYNADTASPRLARPCCGQSPSSRQSAITMRC